MPLISTNNGSLFFFFLPEKVSPRSRIPNLSPIRSLPATRPQVTRSIGTRGRRLESRPLHPVFLPPPRCCACRWAVPGLQPPVVLRPGAPANRGPDLARSVRECIAGKWRRSWPSTPRSKEQELESLTEKG
jgi:hypothetical protein